ncbi:AraC family transcriptional regulator [Lachnospiraceae bacterium LCP25S3_G4]
MEFKHELVIPNDDLPFRMFIFEGYNGNYQVEKHWHRSIEIFAVYKGDIEFYINSKMYHLVPGNFVLLNSNEIHSILSPHRNTTIVLQIPLKVFEHYFTEHQFIAFTHSPREQDEQVMNLIAEMYQIYSERNLAYELKVQSQFFMLIYLLVTKYRDQKASPEAVRVNQKLNRLSTITGYIRDNYTQDMSLEGLAGIFGYSPAYLSRMFQKYAKINYKAYLQNVRVEFAYKELANTSNSISDIAVNNGFPNSKAFSKAFKKKYGVLPSEYRKRGNINEYIKDME